MPASLAPTSDPPSRAAVRASRASLPDAFTSIGAGNAGASCFFGAIIPLSLYWDFSWESSIGVDRFWSPPHLAAHLATWLSALVGIRLLIRFTWRRSCALDHSGVRVGPLSAPAGAWVLLWSALLLQANFPLDLWWQRAYGLGAGLWPPPQILKTFGYFGLLFGGLLLCAARQNYADSGSPDHKNENRLNHLILACLAGSFLALATLILVVSNYPNSQHSSDFFLLSSGVYPGLLLLGGKASRHRWGVTAAAMAYTLMVGLMVWMLPLFPAHPLAPPIHNSISHMVPPPFPLLLLVPALAFDLSDRLTARLNSTARAMLLSLCAGIGFVAIFMPVQWYFAKFLLSTGADNWFFAGGGRHWPYFLKIDHSRVLFWNGPQNSVNPKTILISILLACFSAALGRAIGSWLRRVRR